MMFKTTKIAISNIKTSENDNPKTLKNVYFNILTPFEHVGISDNFISRKHHIIRFYGLDIFHIQSLWFQAMFDR